MKKRMPALVRAVARYNTLCDRLRDLLPPGKTFPLPERLPEDLATLKNDPLLLEDVWITSDTPAGLWLTDKAIRRGIRAQHILDRCAEESIRLKQEERSLYAWVYNEVLALEHAIHDPDSAHCRSGWGRRAHRLQMPPSRPSFSMNLCDWRTSSPAALTTMGSR